mgnify:FL=1
MYNKRKDGKVRKYRKGDKVMIKSLTYEEKHNGPLDWLTIHENLIGKILTIKNTYRQNLYSFEETWVVMWGEHLEKINERDFVLY